MKKIIQLGISIIAISGFLAACQNQGESSSVGEEVVSTQAISAEDTAEKSTDSASSDATDDQSNSESTKNDSSTLIGLSTTFDDAVVLYFETFPNTFITSIDIEKENEGFTFDFDGEDDLNEYELDVNSQGQVIEQESDEDDYNDEDNYINIENLLPLDEITAIAEGEVGSGSATDWDLDRDDGVTHWDVDISDGNNDDDDTEALVNAETGEVISINVDDD